MTAEIAILNKTAVALATDSAVTISNGNTALKIFESADKLFELTKNQPIAIMVYNGMQFLGVPWETIIKNFRRNCGTFETVEEAAKAFLDSLYKYVDSAPTVELASSVRSVIATLISELNDAIRDEIFSALTATGDPKSAIHEDVPAFIEHVSRQVIENHREIVRSLPSVQYIEREVPEDVSSQYLGFIEDAVRQGIDPSIRPFEAEIVELCKELMASEFLSNSRTGIVFAGFGEEETFPTLYSYEVDGLNLGKVRIVMTDHCDIDRDGRRAYVRPFAQKEMVDRFLHGLDDNLRSDISKFCENTLNSILHELVNPIDFANPTDMEELVRRSDAGRDLFLQGLREQAFDMFEQRSRREIEDMVEFMPKPELAKMAEALIDLTSIKRKVTQGLETVGGPVDVAVISKNDGFVWIKRKHYFEPKLNTGFMSRVGAN